MLRDAPPRGLGRLRVRLVPKGRPREFERLPGVTGLAWDRHTQGLQRKDQSRLCRVGGRCTLLPHQLSVRPRTRRYSCVENRL